jgi:hypothetical protein
MSRPRTASGTLSKLHLCPAYFQLFPGLRRPSYWHHAECLDLPWCVVMRCKITAGVLALIGCGCAPMQVEAQFRSECVGNPELRQACEAEWVEECSRHWDAETNMSKERYIEACRRMARERAEFLSKQKKD